MIESHGQAESRAIDEVFNKQIRAFLKKIGITGQRELEKAVWERVEDGRLQGNETLSASAVVRVPELDLEIPIEEEIRLDQRRPGSPRVDDVQFRRLHRRELVDDRVNGASQLARMALDSLGEFAGSCSATDLGELREALLGFGEELQYARPSMAPIHNLVERWMDRVGALEPADAAELRREAAAAAQALSDDSVHAVSAAAHEAAQLIGPGTTIITHSLSSTVLEAFLELATAGVSAITTESRPGLEGRDLARHLDHARIPVRFITDAQVGHFCARADVALVGADTLLGDGSLVNKAGSYLLALAARDRGVPFYVCCESFKQVPFGPASFEPEALDPAEIEAPAGACITPCNVYFDITPAYLIDAWIDENGVRYANR